SDRRKIARSLQGAALRHAGRVAQSFNAGLAPNGGEEATDVKLANLLVEVGERLLRRSAALVQADRAKLDENYGDQALRNRRSLLTDRLARALTDVRRIVDGAFGTGASLQALGLAGTVGRDPEVVYLKGETVIGKLEAEGLTAPSLQPRGVTVDAEELLGLVREPTEELGAVLEELSNANRDTEQHLVDKLRSMNAFDREATWTARLLEAAFSLAGEEELASRVRRTVRRSTEDLEAELPEVELPEIQLPEIELPAVPGAEATSEPKAVLAVSRPARG
ncbi:MAG: hypothetical protein KDD47_24295, partial [Acidobacteria bacterium]|nr:hypothetical protein [Acidobacteriota bacterium]